MNISLPNINVFKNIVKEHINIENYQAKTSCTLVQFERKWASLYDSVNALICFFVP